ncbi:MAG: hypothetical protein LBS57_03185 [Treponema sp.]|nr:hypothetical protein [Treponema sp.]
MCAICPLQGTGILRTSM